MFNFTLTDDRILVKLDKYEEDRTSLIEVPLYEKGETDGGRPTARISDKQYLAVGTVVKLSPMANEKMNEEGTPLKEGDRVFVNINAVNPAYQFFPIRNKLVISFEGYISITHRLIEAILENEQ